jgi:hypothetical protein
MNMRLPAMTDPRGAYWRQPDGLRDRVGVYFNHATISEADWRALPRYDRSMPSGVYAGKVWRCGKYLCWYGRVRNDRCSVASIRALVTP